ncbi:MAG: hypothetical protein HXY40_06120 [Chloroflexi bacterium]|nr:hypothetical protein [Chloroflexota bacterium]
MNLGAFGILTILNGGLLFTVFRVEAKHRRIVGLSVVLGLFMVYQYALGHRSEGEYWLALGVAGVLNALFWLLIGRYNPPRSDEEIKVIGLDD